MIKAYAKVNLILRIIGKTQSNYHLLQMFNARINLYDEIDIKKIDIDTDQLIFLNSTLSYKTDTLVLDVLRYFKNYFHIKDSFQITITKHIPIGAGLGGGSCDAGAILKYLGDFYHIDIYDETFMHNLQTFGADILYSLYMKPCIVEGTGDKITKLKSCQFNQEFIYIYPNIVASTKEVFKKNKVFHREVSHEELTTCINEKGVSAFYNDLEEACGQTYPKFKTIISEIRKFGYAVMSGSGSSILLFCDEIEQTYDALTRQYEKFYIKRVKFVEE